MKKIFLSCILICVLALNCINVSAKVATEYQSDEIYSELPKAEETVSLVEGNLNIPATSSVLIEPSTLTVLYEDNSAQQMPPASITKIMSLLLIMEAIQDGKLSLDTQITASEHACSMGGSQIWLEPGEKMTLDEMLKAIVIASANDATVAVAEAIAGSEEAFVELMNKRAEELSMTGTHFINCTGLDTDGHLTTAYDVALMSSALIKHELITKYSTVWMDTLRNGESQLVNTNKLVRFYEGCIGLKTGTTSGAGHCLSAAARRNNMTLIAVVMKGNDSASRFAGARTLLDFGFANYAVNEIKAELEKNSISVKGGEYDLLTYEVTDSVNVLTKKGGAEISKSINLPDFVKAPIKKGDVIGTVTVSADGEEVGTMEIKAAESVRKRTLFMIYGWLIRGVVEI